MKKLGLIFSILAFATHAFAAEKAAKELFAERQAHKALNVERHANVTVFEKDMGNGVRCYYLVNSMRHTASEATAKDNAAISCVKVD